MIDALETVIEYLKTDADLNLLTSGRIASRHKFGETSGWPIPSKAVQAQYDGGRPDWYLTRQVARLEFRLYAESQYEASRLYRALVGVTRIAERKPVLTTDGKAFLYWLLPESGPSFFQDPDVGVDMIMVFVSACVAEGDVP